MLKFMTNIKDFIYLTRYFTL